MEHDIPRFELEWSPHRHHVSLVWLDLVPDNLNLLLANVVECWIGAPMNSDTRRRLDADVRHTLHWMIAKGELVWDSLHERWELEV